MLNFDKLIYIILYFLLIAGIILNRKMLYIFFKVFCSILMIVCCHIVLTFLVILGAFTHSLFENDKSQNIILVGRIYDTIYDYSEDLLNNIKLYYLEMFKDLNNLVNIVLLTNFILLLLFLSFSFLVSYGIYLILCYLFF